MIGQTISHYKITEKLGEGGMGVVYKAEDTTLDRPVALKFLAPHLVSDEEIRKRFEREAKAAAALNHPNVCTVHEIAEANGRTFIAMAFLEGESLDKKIETGPLKLKDALDIAGQMARGLQAAHGKKIVHRDIKPANLMIGEDGHVTIMDFGLALLTEGSKLTKLDTTLGTVTYMSPEQTYGMELDHRTDIWALGVVLYEMVTGRQPFEGHYDKAVMYSITNEEPEPMTALRTGVPMELEFIVGKALAKDREERYQHVEDMIVDLRGLGKKLATGKSAVLPAQTITAASQAPKLKRATAVFLAAFAALILLAAGFVVGTSFSGEDPTIPTYTRLTFRRGTVTSARFAPDGNTIVYSAAWEGGRRELFTKRPGSPESRSLNIQDADILAISKTSEMALALRPPRNLIASFGSPDISVPACQGRSKFGPLRRSKSRPVGEGVAVFVGRLERSLRSPFRAAQA